MTGGRILYLVLSPLAELREGFLGALFGTFEIARQTAGERVVLPVGEGGTLEVVGAGGPGRVASVAARLIDRGIEIDGVLLLLPSGDQAGWDEGKAVREDLARRQPPAAFRAFVVDPSRPPGKEASRAMILALVDEQERLMTGGAR